MGCREAMGHLADTPRVQMMVLSGRATTTKLNVTAPSTTTVQFCRVWFGCNPQCFLILYRDTDTYQFSPITAVRVTNINPIRLCVFANWPLPRCVRDHKVCLDDSCCWWRCCCCPILTPFDPFEVLDVSSSALLSTAGVAVIMPSAASVSVLVSVLILWS